MRADEAQQRLPELLHEDRRDLVDGQQLVLRRRYRRRQLLDHRVRQNVHAVPVDAHQRVATRRQRDAKLPLRRLRQARCDLRHQLVLHQTVLRRALGCRARLLRRLLRCLRLLRDRQQDRQLPAPETVHVLTQLRVRVAEAAGVRAVADAQTVLRCQAVHHLQQQVLLQLLPAAQLRTALRAATQHLRKLGHVAARDVHQAVRRQLALKLAH